VLSSHSVVSSSRTVRPCSPWGCRWIGHWRTTWSTVCSAPNSQAAEEAIPICTGRSGNVRHQCGAGPRLFLGGSFWVCVYRCLELKCWVLWGCPPTPRSIDDPPTVPHVCCCCQKNWWVVGRRVQMCVSIWGDVQLHPMDGWALSGAGTREWLGKKQHSPKQQAETRDYKQKHRKRNMSIWPARLSVKLVFKLMSRFSP